MCILKKLQLNKNKKNQKESRRVQRKKGKKIRKPFKDRRREARRRRRAKKKVQKMLKIKFDQETLVETQKSVLLLLNGGGKGFWGWIGDIGVGGFISFQRFGERDLK